MKILYASFCLLLSQLRHEFSFMQPGSIENRFSCTYFKEDITFRHCGLTWEFNFITIQEPSSDRFESMFMTTMELEASKKNPVNVELELKVFFIA